ncbi:MAG: HEPN domain-containing protein [Crocinitomicaceae bacterium]
MKTKVFKNFEEKLEDLEQTVIDCNNIIISDEPVSFVYENANFLTKSFLISLCGYLETYLKDALEVLIIDYNERITKENFPYNLVRWSIENKDKSDSKVQSLLDKKKTRFEDLSIKLKKKDLDAFISGNPFRTKELFTMFGINLDEIDYYNQNKDSVNQIVSKRNNVLHHNDDASDLSNQDILQYIIQIRNYCKKLDEQVDTRITNRQHCI